METILEQSLELAIESCLKFEEFRGRAKDAEKKKKVEKGEGKMRRDERV